MCVWGTATPHTHTHTQSRTRTRFTCFRNLSQWILILYILVFERLEERRTKEVFCFWHIKCDWDIDRTKIMLLNISFCSMPWIYVLNFSGRLFGVVVTWIDRGNDSMQCSRGNPVSFIKETWHYHCTIDSVVTRSRVTNIFPKRATIQLASQHQLAVNWKADMAKATNDACNMNQSQAYDHFETRNGKWHVNLKRP